MEYHPLIFLSCFRVTISNRTRKNTLEVLNLVRVVKAILCTLHSISTCLYSTVSIQMKTLRGNAKVE